MIPSSILQAYASQSPVADALIGELDALFKARDSKWFYTARKKSQESFEQKVESGTVSDPAALEDFVGAMVVVPMLSDVARALTFVEQFFDIGYRRPESEVSTKKKASDFPFDDLRLYGRLRQPPELPTGPIYEMTFEIQIKTFLQHAWSIATHDLVYKYDRVSWARSRVAYQLKALLEHADVSVSEIASLEASTFLQQEGEPEARLQAIIDLVRTEWPPEVLPFDRRRQAMNLDRLAVALRLDPVVEDLSALLARGRSDFGSHPDGFTPYQTIVEYSSLYEPARLVGALTRSDSTVRILVPTGTLRRINLRESEARNALT